MPSQVVYLHVHDVISETPLVWYIHALIIKLILYHMYICVTCTGSSDNGLLTEVYMLLLIECWWYCIGNTTLSLCL